MKVSCTTHPNNILGEGPVWSQSEAALYWVDIKGRAFFTFSPSTGSTSRFRLAEDISALVPRRKGGWLAALASGLAFIDAENLTIQTVVDPEQHLPGNRFNDGKCDSSGRFWVGSMDDSEQALTGNLYRLDADGSIRTLAADLGISNGLGWSPDDRLFYHTDSTRKTIWVYDFDTPSGCLTNRRPFVRVADGLGWPDGLTVDAEGYLWSAHWDGWCLTRYAPDGRIDRTLKLPIPRPTSCTFGGTDLSTLYITSARIGLSDKLLKEAPLSGAVLSLNPGTAGLAAQAFAG